jgi:hypothetical protein
MITAPNQSLDRVARGAVSCRFQLNLPWRLLFEQHRSTQL